MRPRSDDQSEDQQQILEDVAGNGVHVVTVPAERDRPEFTYSIGLWATFEQPDVVVFGLPGEVAQELIELIADEADEGHRFLDGTRHEGLLQEYPVRFVAVPKSHYGAHFAAGLWAYEGDEFPVVQLVWPDKQGRWPWDPAARDGFAANQPVLGRAAAGS